MLRQKKKKSRNNRKRAGDGSSSPLSTRLMHYSEAAAALSDYEAANENVMSNWATLRERCDDAEKAVKMTVLEQPMLREPGKVTVLTLYGYKVVHAVKRRRGVDPAILLKKYPNLRRWKGLLTVNMKSYDQAVAGNRIAPEDVDDLVTTAKQIDTVQIVPENRDG